MKIEEIRKRPTVMTPEFADKHMGPHGVHESLLRAFCIVEKVKDLLVMKTAAEVVLELIELMETPHPGAKVE